MSDHPRRRTPEEILEAVRSGHLDPSEVKIKERATVIMRDMDTGRVERKVVVDGEVIEQIVETEGASRAADTL